jgi:ParB-like chromosome segregation protein Spo0J
MSANGSAPPSVSATEGKGRGGNEAGRLLSPPNNAAADAVKFHPLADLFPLMEGAEFDALVADIKANGLQDSIVLYEGKILDGRNRYRACKAAGVVPRFRVGAPSQEKPNLARPIIADPLAYVINANIHRRHLTAEQKRDLIAKLIKAQPEKSDRQIAETAKASPTTVGTVRTEMEEVGDVSKLDTRTDKRGRKQPANKPKREPSEEREFEETIAPPVILEKLRAAELKITGLESEIEDLKAENADLRRKLEVCKSPVRCEFVEDDGGRAAAGYGGAAGDCVARATAIATSKPYTEVFEALKARHAKYVKRHPDSWEADHMKRRRKAPIEYGCNEKIYAPYLRSLGWQYTRIRERLCLRAGALPPGRLIVALDGHYVAVIDGVIHTYDSGGAGRRQMEGYWSQGDAEAGIELCRDREAQP